MPGEKETARDTTGYACETIPLAEDTDWAWAGAGWSWAAVGGRPSASAAMRQNMTMATTDMTA